MAERTGKELSDMINRIPDETLGKEMKMFLQTLTGVSEVRDVMISFLEFYVRKR